MNFIDNCKHYTVFDDQVFQGRRNYHFMYCAIYEGQWLQLGSVLKQAKHALVGLFYHVLKGQVL